MLPQFGSIAIVRAADIGPATASSDASERAAAAIFTAARRTSNTYRTTRAH